MNAPLTAWGSHQANGQADYREPGLTTGDTVRKVLGIEDEPTLDRLIEERVRSGGRTSASKVKTAHKLIKRKVSQEVSSRMDRLEGMIAAQNSILARLSANLVCPKQGKAKVSKQKNQGKPNQKRALQRQRSVKGKRIIRETTESDIRVPVEYHLVDGGMHPFIQDSIPDELPQQLPLGFCN